jgi:Tfp pilus assembly protein PilF
MPTKPRPARLLAMLVTSLLPALGSGADATISEVEQELLTYPFSDPSPLAHIGRIYPYSRFDGYSAQGVKQRWTMVKLENDYLTVWVVPSIGGKVWSAYDRVNHRDFLYHNPVVKFRDVALRGPWTAGGLEFNFGVIGHAPTCATPVDYVLRHDPDGGVSCCIGALDLPSRTEWRVVIRLPRDQAAFATEASWHNDTDFHQSCYQWMTAAAEASDDLVVSHPGHHYLEHGGRAQTWPQDAAGHTLSHYRDNAFGDSKSYHVVGAEAEWFGGYYPNRDAGYGHWSLFGDKPGQKVWLWSLSREGAIWRDLLTDPPAPQYIEMQSGLMHSQADDSSSATPFKHAALEPGAALQWSELWFPLSAIGGIAEASPWGALNVTRSGDSLVVAICPLRALDEELRVTAAGELIHHQRLLAQPLTATTLTIPLHQHDGILAVEVGDGLLSWHSDDADRQRLDRPLILTAAPSPGSAEGLYSAGEEHLRQRDYAKALASFAACLEVEPCHLRALTRGAELSCRRGEDLEALALARQALALDATDAGANFAYGTANAALGNASDAMDGFAWAARSPALRTQADYHLARLCMRANEWWRAAEYAQRGGEDALDGQECRFLAAVIARHRRQSAAAGVLLDGILARDPLHHGARFERLLLDGGDAARAAFLQPLRGESPDQTCLELALRYAALGDDDAALAVLALSPPQAMIGFWQAYLRRDRDHAGSDRDLARALAAPVRLVFPSRVESIAVLRWAAQRQPHWKSSYYLGLLLLGLGRDNEARTTLLACGDAPDEAAFYLNRSRIFTVFERERTLADLERARSLDAADWRASHLLVGVRLEAGENLRAVELAAAALQAFPGNQALTMDLAAAQLAAGRYREVIALLAAATVLPFEGATDGRALYRRANLFAALQELKRGHLDAAEICISDARSWPEHLGAGRPYDPDERLEDFLGARCRHARGDEQGARQAYQRIADWTGQQHPGFGCMSLISALALRELGRSGEAAALLSRWHDHAPDDATYQPWAQAVFSGDPDGARQALLDPQTRTPRPLRLLARRQGDFPLIAAVVESLAP